MFHEGLENDAFDPRFDHPNSPKCMEGKGCASAHLGTVKKIEKFGAFVFIPARKREGLLHISQIAQERVNDVSDFLAIGQEIWVKINKETPDGKFSLSMKELNQTDGSERQSLHAHLSSRGQGGGVKIPSLGTIHFATIKRIQQFGAFAALEGFDRDGLLHISCISSQKIDRVEDVLGVGDKIWVKVTKVDEDGKFGLDMRNVSQKDGVDNDPNNLNRATGNRGKPFKQEAIVLDEVPKVTCRRCGARGHMSHECFNKSGAKYELLEEENAVGEFSASRHLIPQAATGANCVPCTPRGIATMKAGVGEIELKRSKRSKREKEEKRAGKHKHKRKRSSSSDSDSSRHRKKKSKKVKKPQATQRLTGFLWRFYLSV